MKSKTILLVALFLLPALAAKLHASSIFLQSGVTGTHHGLFAPSDGPRQQTNSGAISFTITSSGGLSGRLVIGANAPLLSGRFDAVTGAVTDVIHRQGGLSTLTAFLQLDFVGRTISGYVTDGNFVAPVTANLDVFSLQQPAVNYEGRYTLIIPGVNDPTVGPVGTSYGTVQVGPLGHILFAGAMADGTTVSQASVVAQDGSWPFYVPMYGGHGSLWGWIYFANGAINSANVSWINGTNSVKADLYREGFTNNAISVISSAYNPRSKPLLALTYGQVTLQGDQGTFTITDQIALAQNNSISAPGNPNKLVLAVSQTTPGVISGSFANPSNPGQTLKIRGVLLQNQNEAVGYFLGPNQGGTFVLTPSTQPPPPPPPPDGGSSPGSIPGLAYYWNFNDLPYGVATTSWKDRIHGVVLNNYNPSALNPTNSALGLRLPNYGSDSSLLTCPTITVGGNFTLWMVIRERVNRDQAVQPTSCLFGSMNGPAGLMLNNGVIGCDWGNGPATVAGAIPANQVVDLVYSQGQVYIDGNPLGALPQPAGNFGFQTVGDIMPGGGGGSSPFIGYIEYIGIWPNTLFSAGQVASLDRWVKTNGVSNVTSGLAAWWKLNEGGGTKVTDYSGNGYGGNITGSGVTWDSTAPMGGGLAFNGQDTLVKTVNVPNTWANMSLSFWIKSPFPGGSILGAQAVPIGHSANMPNMLQSGPGWQAYFEGNFMRFLTIDTAGNYAEVANQYIINDGAWHHCVLEIGSGPSDVIGYTDGELVTDTPNFSGIPGSIIANVPVTMGTVTDPVHGPFRPYFKGSLADVRIYTNHLLGPREVADLFRWRGQP